MLLGCCQKTEGHRYGTPDDGSRAGRTERKCSGALKTAGSVLPGARFSCFLLPCGRGCNKPSGSRMNALGGLGNDAGQMAFGGWIGLPVARFAVETGPSGNRRRSCSGW